jgi:hypothetical protein
MDGVHFHVDKYVSELGQRCGTTRESMVPILTDCSRVPCKVRLRVKVHNTAVELLKMFNETTVCTELVVTGRLRATTNIAAPSSPLWNVRQPVLRFSQAMSTGQMLG